MNDSWVDYLRDAEIFTEMFSASLKLKGGFEKSLVYQRIWQSHFQKNSPPSYFKSS